MLITNKSINGTLDSHICCSLKVRRIKREMIFNEKYLVLLLEFLGYYEL